MARLWFRPAPPPEDGAPELPTGRKLLWFFGLMAGSVCVVAASAYALRALLFIG